MRRQRNDNDRKYRLAWAFVLLTIAVLMAHSCRPRPAEMVPVVNALGGVDTVAWPLKTSPAARQDETVKH